MSLCRALQNVNDAQSADSKAARDTRPTSALLPPQLTLTTLKAKFVVAQSYLRSCRWAAPLACPQVLVVHVPSRARLLMLYVLSGNRACVETHRSAALIMRRRSADDADVIQAQNEAFQKQIVNGPFNSAIVINERGRGVKRKGFDIKCTGS
jgi:hypothetical protein